eukprot:148741-Amphidinium_carterae.1
MNQTIRSGSAWPDWYSMKEGSKVLSEMVKWAASFVCHFQTLWDIGSTTVCSHRHLEAHILVQHQV